MYTLVCSAECPVLFNSAIQFRFDEPIDTTDIPAHPGTGAFLYCKHCHHAVFTENHVAGHNYTLKTGGPSAVRKWLTRTYL